MKQDNAIKQALKRRIYGELPPDFASKTIKRIYRIEKQRRKRIFILNLCSLAGASFGLIFLAGYLTRNYWHVLKPSTPSFSISPETINQYGFGFYIAALILILAIADHYARHFFYKKKFKH